KQSTKMLFADRILRDLIRVARGANNPIANAAAEVLDNWDRTGNDTSRGSVLFERWLEYYVSDPRTPRSRVFGNAYPAFGREWSAAKAFDTPAGLADPSAALTPLILAAKDLIAEYGRLDVMWGEIHRAVLPWHDRTFERRIPISNTPIS